MKRGKLNTLNMNQYLAWVCEGLWEVYPYPTK
jgi:hypothetical protein